VTKFAHYYYAKEIGIFIANVKRPNILLIMRYLLRKIVISPVPEVEISAEEFLGLKAARRVLSNAFAIEEKYEIVISNFLDLEKQLLDIAATNSLRETNTYAEFFETRSLFNVRLVNLLTSTRLYLDQLPQHIADCVPSDSGAVSLVKTKCSEEYDKHFEFRFMEALRNYVQHRGIPVHLVRHKSGWTSSDQDRLLEFSVYIAAQRDQLEEDEKFKKSVLQEITTDIDLMAASRKYLESISAINGFVRKLLSDQIKSARKVIEAAHLRYSEVCSETLTGLSALEMEDSRVISSVPLLLEWDDVRIQLQQRNKQLINLSKRYVTSRTSV
jgi:hypothetical protein